MKYKILITNLLKLNVRLFAKSPFNDEIFIIDNNIDQISKFFNSMTYSNVILHTIDTINVDMEEVGSWGIDICMMLDFPDEETALYFMMKYPAIIEVKNDA